MKPYNRRLHVLDVRHAREQKKLRRKTSTLAKALQDVVTKARAAASQLLSCFPLTEIQAASPFWGNTYRRKTASFLHTSAFQTEQLLTPLREVSESALKLAARMQKAREEELATKLLCGDYETE